MARAGSLAFLAALLIIYPTHAQDVPPVHHHVAVNMIDGAVHPELIPDLTAWRLYLVMASESPNPPADRKLRQDARLRKIGLQEPDRLALIAALSSFRSQYLDLIRTYNEAATAAWTQQKRSDVKPLLLQRDNLVQSTHDTLRGVLSADGFAALDAHVQSEKARMKIAAKEATQ